MVSNRFRRRLVLHVLRHPTVLVRLARIRWSNARQLLQCSECGQVGRRRPLERHTCTGSRSGIRGRCEGCGKRRRVKSARIIDGRGSRDGLLCSSCRREAA